MKRRELEVDSANWMITFSDLMMLVLTFFVLRYSMSSIQPQTFRESVSDSEVTSPSRFDIQSAELSATKAENFSSVAGLLVSTLGYPEQTEQGSLRYRGAVALSTRGNATLLVLGSSAFSSGDDQLTFHAAEALHALALWLRTSPARARISAYTDATTSESFNSNWELSLARSLAAGRQIVDAGVEESRLEVMGYANTKPLFTDGNPLRQHQNRRLEIEILPLPASPEK
jgi:chemotaxis protein MotB